MKTLEDFEKELAECRSRLQENGHVLDHPQRNDNDLSNWGEFDLPYSSFPRQYEVKLNSNEWSKKIVAAI